MKEVDKLLFIEDQILDNYFNKRQNFIMISSFDMKDDSFTILKLQELAIQHPTE